MAAKQLDRLRASDINALVVELRARTKSRGERQLSESSVERAIRVLGLVLESAIREQLIPLFRECLNWGERALPLGRNKL